jgi:hypothetical protein
MWISFKGQGRKRKSKSREESSETKARGAYGGGHTFVTIDLFTGWFTVFFSQESPNYIRKAILGTMKESFKVGLPSSGRFSCCIL